MRVRCRAVADPRSNALGVLELEVSPEGLWLSYESVSSYREGYAPGPPALCSEHRVPWPRVRASRMGSELLRLEVQEPLSPFSHFVLRDFAHAEPQAWLARARVWTRLDSPQIVLTQLCHELSLWLGAPVAPDVSAQGQQAVERLSRLRSLPASSVALLILLCSSVLAAMMLIRAPQPAPPPTSTAETLAAATPGPPQQPPPMQPAPAPTAATPEPSSALEQADLPVIPAPALGGGCECIRHESLLWQQPPPRLAAFVTKLERRAHGSHQHVELELTVVNNGDRPLRGLSLGVQISTTNAEPGDAEAAPVERSQYFPGPLAPGEQLSWQAGARGDRFRLRIPELGLLDEDGLDAAPAAAFAALAAGPPGFVRLHGATMLAFLGDAGARAALLKAREGLPDSAGAHVERALESTDSLRICQRVVSLVGHTTRTQSCLYNAADVAQSEFELKVRALSAVTPTPAEPFPIAQVLAEETLHWSGTLPPRRGRRLDLTIDLSRTGRLPEHRIELLALSKVRPE